MEITKIYTKYFDIINDYFGSIKHYLGNAEDSHIDLGINIANYPLISDLILDAIDDLNIVVENFWKENAKQVFDYIKRQKTLKCLYSGDISPVILENFVKRSALYIDTVILPDPIYKLTLLQRQFISDQKYYLNKLIRHVFNIWKLKDLVLADTKERIILILPIDFHHIVDTDKSRLLNNADERFSVYINNLFTQKFGDRESSLDFLRQQKTSRDIFEKIKRHDLLPNKFKQFETFDKFLIDFSSTGKYSKFNSETVGLSFALYLHSQFIRVQEHKFFCDRLVAEPIYDYELPWFFFNYEVGGVDMDASIANALQQERFKWISRVPLSALKILREENKLDYMRCVIRKGVTDLKAKRDKDLLEVSKQIEKNLKEEFDRQKMEIGALEKEVQNITKKEIPITTGGFLAGFIPYLGNVISLITAGKDISKLLQKHKQIKQNIHDKENNFINLLMKSYDGK